MRGRLRRHSRSGFTIAEVMMAAAVMALAITTSITTMQRAFLALDLSRNLTVAGQIMTSEMERIRMLSWADVSVPTLGETNTVALDAIFTNNPQITNRFTLTRTDSLPDASNPNIREITLTITWRGYDGSQHTRSYTTYYAHYGIHDYLYNTA